MKAERTEFNNQSKGVSNGFRNRNVLANGVSLELSVPRSRNHNFYPLLLALIKDQNDELAQITTELYCAGLTTEQIGEITDKIYGKHYSKSSISNLMSNAKLDVEAWLKRKLDKSYPIIYIDATFWYTRRDKSVSSEAYYTILGVKQDRTREVLAIVNHPTEGSENWKGIFKSLKERGVEEIKLVVSDALNGIEDSFAEIYPNAQSQLCTFHLSRNISKKVKPTDRKEVMADLKAVLNPDNPSDDQSLGYQRFMLFVSKWEKKYPSFKSLRSPRYILYFTYLNYHIEVRRMIYTTNWIERLNRNYKRVLKMRTSMPSPESVLFLLGSVAMRRKEFNYPIYQFSYESELF